MILVIVATQQMLRIRMSKNCEDPILSMPHPTGDTRAYTARNCRDISLSMPHSAGYTHVCIVQNCQDTILSEPHSAGDTPVCIEHMRKDSFGALAQVIEYARVWQN